MTYYLITNIIMENTDPYKQKYLIFDTETTSAEAKEAKVIQIAFGREHWSPVGSNWGITRHGYEEAYYDPGMPIPTIVKSITNIPDDMVKGCPDFNGSHEMIKIRKLLDEGYIPVAHNADYDVQVLRNYGIKIKDYICTMKVALRLKEADDFENVKLNYLRHFFNIPNIEGQLHDALTDTEYLAKVFEILVIKQQLTPQQMIAVSKSPPLFRRCTFGNKHRGELWSEVAKKDPGYLRWILEKYDDPNTKWIADYWLNKSEGQDSIYG